MHRNCWEFQNRNVQTFGFVYHDTNCLNHGPVWKTQSFLLSEMCTVILWQDCYGKGNLRTFYWSTVGKKFQIGNASIGARLGKSSKLGMLVCKAWKGLFFCVYADDIKLVGKKKNIDPMWKLLMKQVDFGEPTSFLDHVYLGCTQRQCKIRNEKFGKLQRHVWIANFRGGSRKNFHSLKIFVFLHGLVTWLVMQRSVWNDIVSWQTRRLSNSTKYLLHASMTTSSKKKIWNLLENCHMYALKLFWNVYTWHELGDLIFYGQ